MSYAIFFICLGASLLGNIALTIKLYKSKKEPAPTLEAKELMAAMMQGNAVVQIRVLDPEHLMLRSPRR